jgi:signal transduction histidine kinase
MKRYVSLWTLCLTLLMAVLLFLAGTLAYVKIQGEEAASQMRAMASLANDASELSMLHAAEADAADEGAVSVARQNGVLTVQTVAATRSGAAVLLSMPLPGFRSFLLWMGAGSLLLTALMQLLALLATSKITQRLQRPLEQINALLNSPDAAVSHDKGGIFPEVVPLLDNITSKIDKLQYDLEEVRRTQRIRSDFVANASHELKTPLTSIKGFAELLNDGLTKDESQRKEAAQRILSETNRLLAIIEDILNLSRAERG